MKICRSIDLMGQQDISDRVFRQFAIFSTSHSGRVSASTSGCRGG